MTEPRLSSEIAMDSEIAVAGSILIDPRCLDEVRRHVTADAFLFEHCREIFTIACDLADNGEKIDPLTILAKGTTFDRNFLFQAMEITPTAANAGIYAKLVTREALRRDYIAKLEQAVKDLSAGHDPVHVASDIQGESERVANEEVEGQVVDAAKAALELYDDMQRIESGYQPFIPTGYKSLDDILGGGMIREGMYILAARPGCGKTTFAVNIAQRILQKGTKVLLISLEMSRQQLTARFMAASFGKLTATQILTNAYPKTPELVDGVMQSLSEVSKYPLYFNRRGALNIKEIHFLAKQTKADVVIIDYLGLMKHGEGKSLYEKVTATSNQIKRMARNLGIPVLCLCQLNREVEGRKNDPPRLSDLRDSGAIEQDADAVMLIHKFNLEDTSEYDAVPMEIHIAKNRHGKTGKVEFNWYMRNGRILERR